MARKPKAKKKLNRKTWIIQQLRRISLKWPPRNRVDKATRRELPRKLKKDGTPYKRPNYEHLCNICNKWFKSSEVVMDHVEPVVDVDSNPDMPEWEYIGKFAVDLLCYEDNFQKLCINCHDEKTKKENEMRKKS